MNGLSALYGYNKMAVVHLTHKPEYLIVLRGYFLCRVPCIARMLRPALFHKFYALLSLILWVFSTLKKTHTCRADLVFLDIYEQKSSFPVTAGTIRSYNVSDLSHKGHHSDRLAGHLTHFRLRTYSEGSTVDIWLFKRQTPLLCIYVTAYLRNIQPLGGYYFSYMFTVGDVLNTLKCLPIVFNAYHYKPINFLFAYACSIRSIFGR